MRKVAVVGVGNSKFGKRKDVNLPELSFEAIKEALQDAKLSQNDIEFTALGNVGTFNEDLSPAPIVAEYAELNNSGLMRCEAACASGSAAFYSAYQTIASGSIDIAMVVGVEKMTEVETSTAVEILGRLGSYFWEFENIGMTFPGYYALYAVSHMQKYNTTEEQMAMIAVKNHKYGSMNPSAHFQKEITLQDVLESPIIAWPLKLLDCCPITDGSAALILASEDKARTITDSPIWIDGIGVASDSANINNRSDFLGLKSSVVAAKKAYEMAKIEPNDIEVAKIHDCFTIAEILGYEDLGFCKKGEGGKLIEEGQTYIGGKIPVNVDGGLKATGHALGATGCMMIVELTTQLRGTAGNRQVPLNKGYGLTHNVGGTGQFCYVTVLHR